MIFYANFVTTKIENVGTTINEIYIYIYMYIFTML